jgi:hypothetical protein
MLNKKMLILDQIKNSILEIQQPRSRFQLEKFVLGPHPTKEMQYYQVCLELQDMLFKYELAKIQESKINLKIAKYKNSDNQFDSLKAKKQELNLEQLKITMFGAEREIAHLVDIWSTFETKYTREQIEDSQADYWKQRLTINAKAMSFGQGTINPAHIEAMEQAGVLDDYVKEVEAANELRNLEA